MSDEKQDHKPKMAVPPQSPPGQEQDDHGNVIPLSQRTKDDQEKALKADPKADKNI